ncbi:MAG: sugar phosphate isomerase/epimerase [Armatimonadetes bacterium]|nr:sugar phosphate isomerase/epimerase [Armatimonadota bacterium]
MPKGKIPTARPRLALCTIAFRERLVENVLDLAKELGFEGVELWGREPHVSEVYDYNRTRLCRRMCEERGLEIAALGSYLRFAPTRKNSDDASLLDTLHTAHTLRAPIVRVWASDVPSAKASAALWEQVVTEAREAARRSRRLGIVLAVEMHDDTLCDTADSARRLVEEVGCDNLRLNFQVGARQGCEDPVERLKKVCDYVVHVHAQNFFQLSTANGDGPKRAPLGEGIVDYETLISLLRQRGYTGWISVEFASVEGDGKTEAIAADLAYLRRLVGA